MDLFARIDRMFKELNRIERYIENEQYWARRRNFRLAHYDTRKMLENLLIQKTRQQHTNNPANPSTLQDQMH